jgi:hypothetical protein
MIKTFEQFNKTSISKINYRDRYNDLLIDCELYIIELIKANGGEVDLSKAPLLELECYDEYMDDTRYTKIVKIRVANENNSKMDSKYLNLNNEYQPVKNNENEWIELDTENGLSLPRYMFYDKSNELFKINETLLKIIK